LTPLRGPGYSFSVAEGDEVQSRLSYGARQDSKAANDSHLYMVSHKRHTFNCDCRITVLPELPKLVKRVRLPSVAYENDLGKAGVVFFVGD
jgi:hypothetical protein